MDPQPSPTLGSVAPRQATAVGERFALIRRLGRVALAGGMLTLAWTAITRMDDLRVAEAWLGARVVDVAMGRSYHPSGTAMVYFPTGSLTTRSLEITWQCSVVWAAVPLLAFSAGLVLVPRTSCARVVLAAALGTVVVAVANQLRLLVIALSTAWWGRDGFEVSHRIVGSGLVLVSVVVGLALVWRSGPAGSPVRADRVAGPAPRG